MMLSHLRPRSLSPSRYLAVGAALATLVVPVTAKLHGQELQSPTTANYPGGGESPVQGENAAPASEGTPAPAAAPAADPPARVVRLGVMNGNVSAEPNGVNTFSPAELNEVLTTGDRVYTDTSAAAELETGQLAVRLAGGTDLTVTAMTDVLAQFGLAAGSVHLRSMAIDAGTVTELDSPEAAITVLQPGDLRVDVDPAAHTTTVTVSAGQVQVDGPGSSQVLSPGQRVRLHGGNPDTGEPAYTEPLAAGDTDSLDSFSADRDSREASGLDAASPYVSADTVGSADLADYGSWDTGDSGDTGGGAGAFGAVWFPVVAADWHPYGSGHWRYIRPWGWTWVGAEPWGFAPFHYGRWAQFGGRWGWIPGPRVVRPVYAPALVVFAGGAQFAGSLGFAPGFGIAAWFPLGPREPYAPPYGGSTLYVNRINASNLYNPNAAEVRAFYRQRAVNVFGTAASANRVYVNRLAATTAVPQSAFAAGRSVQNANLRLPAEALAAAPVLPHPPTSPSGNPEHAPVARRPAVALPPNLARPMLAGSAGTERAGAGTAGTVLFHRADPSGSPESRRNATGAPVYAPQGTSVYIPGEPSRTVRPSGPPPPTGGQPVHGTGTRAPEPAHAAVPPASAAPASHPHP